ncbi:type VII secretion target [Nocardia sp. CA-128927]|uniref:type VII secretion target n=1 Tax=Nocardia sp. CA-128927 TaxID=3239975 RepID=UPI003D98C2FD
MADDLTVEPATLDGLSTKLKQLGTDNAQSEAYLKEHVDLSRDQAGVIFGRVADTIQQLRADLASNYEKLGRLTTQSGDEVAKAAQMYRTTDRATAAALDRTYPGGKR